MAALVWSGVMAVERGPTREIACWVLPNARPLITVRDPRCPMQPGDEIRRVWVSRNESRSITEPRVLERALSAAEHGIDLVVWRDGAEVGLSIPIQVVSRSERVARLLAAFLLVAGLFCIPLLLLLKSRSRAALPFALFYAAVSIVAVTVMSGRSSQALARAALLAMVAAPAALSHLSLAFPRERRVIREAPELAFIPYALAALLVPVGWVALDQNPILWPTFLVLLLALTAGAWLVLILSCAFAIRESTSRIDRARARVLCYGALVVPVLPMLVLTQFAGGPAQAATAYLWTSAAVIPLPVGLAISRHNLFDLGWDVRRWIGRAVYLGAAAIVVALFFELAFLVAASSRPPLDPAVLWLVSFGSIAVIEPIRGRLLGFLEIHLAPRLEHLRRVRMEFEREILQLKDEDRVACSLGNAASRALNPRWAAVFCSVDSGWRLAHAVNAGCPIDPEEASRIDDFLGSKPVMDLLMESHDEEPPFPFPRRDVQLCARVFRSTRTYGLLLVSERMDDAPYTTAELEFLAQLASQAAIAVENAKLAKNLIDAERKAVTGRIALALAHDLGKELDWVGRLVKRLPKLLDDRDRLARDIETIHDFTDEIVRGLRRFVAEATSAASTRPGFARFDDLADRAIRKMSRIHGADRVTLSVDPDLAGVRCPEDLERVMANLLDNALHATAAGEPVQLFGTWEHDSIRVTILDHGSGMSKRTRNAAFQSGFTTRGGAGGLGIGLGVAKEIVERLHGSIELAPGSPRGTRASVRLPGVAVECPRRAT